MARQKPKEDDYFYGTILNTYLYLCCFVVLFILMTRGKTEVLHLDNVSCIA